MKYPFLRASFLIGVAILACYGTALSAPFIWDDEVMVMGNPLITSLGRIADIFTSSAFGEPFHPSLFYRPIQILSYVIDFKMWGLDPFGFRLTNVVFHFINSLLVLAIFKRFFGYGISVFLAVVFAVHPIAIESVTYISGRGDVLSVVFALSSILAIMISFEGDDFRWAGLAFIFYILTVLTKENCVLTPLIWVVIWLCLYRERARIGQKIVMLSAVLIAGAYSLFRLFGGGESMTKTLSFIAEAPLYHRILTLPKVMITYLKLTVFPYPLHMEYHFVTTSIWDWTVILGVPALALLLWVMIRFCRNRRVMMVFLGVVGVGLIPVNNVMLALASTLREHWFYLPLVGILGCVGLGLSQWMEGDFYRQNPWVARVAFGLGCVVVLGLSGATYMRNLDWKDPIRFFTHDIQHEPKGFILYNNLGVEYFRRGDYEQARTQFYRSIMTSPSQRYGIAYNNLGAVYLRYGDLERAEALFRKSIALSNYPLAHRNLESMGL